MPRFWRAPRGRAEALGHVAWVRHRRDLRRQLTRSVAVRRVVEQRPDRVTDGALGHLARHQYELGTATRVLELNRARAGTVRAVTRLQLFPLDARLIPQASHSPAEPGRISA